MSACCCAVVIVVPVCSGIVLVMLTCDGGVVMQGYQQMMEWFGGVRRVRGDNYCALRATLFQVLSQTTQSPAWLHQDHFTMVTARR